MVPIGSPYKLFSVEQLNFLFMGEPRPDAQYPTGQLGRWMGPLVQWSFKLGSNHPQRYQFPLADWEPKPKLRWNSRKFERVELIYIGPNAPRSSVWSTVPKGWRNLPLPLRVQVAVVRHCGCLTVVQLKSVFLAKVVKFEERCPGMNLFRSAGNPSADQTWREWLHSWSCCSSQMCPWRLRNLLVATAVVMLGMVGLMMIGWDAIAAL